eukprot:Skav213545  [mRNA]  locus=scaffold3239:58125:59357:+ [translate_table: standard]
MITGAIAGVFLADYWIVKQRVLDLEEPLGAGDTLKATQQRMKELYSATGVNWKALLAVFLGAAPCIPGFINALLVHGAQQKDLVGPFWAHLYSGGSCLFSLAASGSLYLIFNSLQRRRKGSLTGDLGSCETAV